MTTLSDKVIAIERQADAILDQARAEAQRIVAETAAQQQTISDELARQTQARIEAFRQEAEARQARELATSAAEFTAAEKAIDAIPSARVEELAGEAVARFREA